MLKIQTLVTFIATLLIVAVACPSALAGKGGNHDHELTQQQLLLLYAASHQPGPDNSHVGVSPFVPPVVGGGGGGQKPGNTD